MSGSGGGAAGGTEDVVLDGSGLDLASFVAVARDRARVVVRDWSAVEACRGWLDEEIDAWRRGGAVVPVYGVMTGFGSSRNVVLSPADVEDAQANLVRSHAFGVAPGQDDTFSEDVVRGAMLLRANTFLAGRSGVRRDLVELLVALLNAGVHPNVPLRGSVGASGDLCPLAHLALVLLGEGEATMPGSGVRRMAPGAEALAAAGLSPIRLAAKEGLALINGTPVSTACLALAAHDATMLSRAADVACAMTWEALGASGRSLEPQVHVARRQAGQQLVAQSLRRLLGGSGMLSASDDRQDPYSLRCAPQVHGASRDALGFALEACERELNAVTDNPLFFVLPGDDEPWAVSAESANSARLGREPEGGKAVSAGNFHGQPIAVAADVLSIAAAEFASISERRIALLVNPAFSRGLPAHLAARPGRQSGLMLAQYSAASLVSENKTLAHPASVDSIPTGNGVEDHVPMATWAARKSARIVSLATHVLAIELLAAAQALEWRALRPDPSARAAFPADPAEIEALARRFETLTAEDATSNLSPATGAAYRAVRAVTQRVVADRSVAGDVAALARAIGSGGFSEAALPAAG